MKKLILYIVNNKTVLTPFLPFVGCLFIVIIGTSSVETRMMLTEVFSFPPDEDPDEVRYVRKLERDIQSMEEQIKRRQDSMDFQVRILRAKEGF